MTDKHSTMISSFARKVAFVIMEKRRWILIAAAVAAIAAIVCIPMLTREVNMLEYFEPGSEIRKTETMMEESFGGSIPIQILVRGNLKDPQVLKEMLRFEKYLATLPDVNSPQSIADIIVEMNDVMNDHRTVPDTREGVANLWLFIEGNNVIEQMINSTATEGIIQASLGGVNTRTVLQLTESIDRYLTNEFEKKFISADVSKVPTTIASNMRRRLVKKITRSIELDAKAVVSEISFNSDKVELVLNRLIDDQGRAHFIREKDAFLLRQRIAKYLLSSSSDVEVDSKPIAEAITGEIAGRATNAGISVDQIRTVLLKHLPESVVEDDPESIGYAVVSLKAIVDQAEKEALVVTAMGAIRPLLPKELLLQDEFLSDLRNDLWDLCDSRLTVDYKHASHISDVATPEKSEIKAKQTGMPIIYMDLDKKVVKSQLQSLGIALCLVFLLLVFQFKSVAVGFVSIIPIILTVLVNFGVMGIFSIAIDPATAMISAVAIGIGIDYMVHFMSRYKAEIIAGRETREAIEITLKTAGQAILINASVVTLGFLVFLGGSIVPMKYFGGLMALTMVTSATFALTVLPALILSMHIRFGNNAAQAGSRP